MYVQTPPVQVPAPLLKEHTLPSLPLLSAKEESTVLIFAKRDTKETAHQFRTSVFVLMATQVAPLWE